MKDFVKTDNGYQIYATANNEALTIDKDQYSSMKWSIEKDKQTLVNIKEELDDSALDLSDEKDIFDVIFK